MGASRRGGHPTGQYNYLKALIGLIGLSKHSRTDVPRFLRNTYPSDETVASLPEVADTQPGAIVWTYDSWNSVDQELARLKKGKAV